MAIMIRVRVNGVGPPIDGWKTSERPIEAQFVRDHCTEVLNSFAKAIQ
jgi:hypothetical protein